MASDCRFANTSILRGKASFEMRHSCQAFIFPHIGESGALSINFFHLVG
jgi:hypothetical protein